MSVRSRSLLTAAVAAGALPAAAAAAAPQVEQINRATGAAGAFGLVEARPLPVIGGITDDGRYAFFGVRKAPFGGDGFEDAIPGDGLYARDIVANRTVRITDGSADFTGIDRTGHAISFVTSQSFDPADTNGKPDLYAYEPVTGIKVLISRATGYRGAALGLTSLGAVAPGTLRAVFGTADGVFRRDLLAGRTTRIGGGSFVRSVVPDPNVPQTQGRADVYVSADGKIVVTSAGIVTPTVTRPLPTDSNGEPVQPFISETQGVAVWQSDPQSPASIRRMNVATGVVSTPTVPAAIAGAFGQFVSISPDGGAGYFQMYKQNDQGDFVVAPVKWNFTTGAVTDLGLPALVSRNGKFGLTGARSGAILATATTGNTLPGTVDLPSPNAYVRFSDGCGPNADFSADVRQLTISPEFNAPLPKAATVRVKATAFTGGPVVVDQTVAVPTIDGFFPELDIALPFPSGGFRADVTVRLADGRSITERTVRTPRPSNDGC